MTTAMTAFADEAAAVNGPEDLDSDWDAVGWRAVEDEVRRLRQRIFKASKNGDLAKVRNLQKLMLRSHANTLVSVRQVTQRNAGRRTPGVDGEVVVTSQDRVELVRWAGSRPDWQPRPVRRVYIPKANGKQRPIGIPVIADRVLQARVKNALEPEWEARFEPRSYGFRPGRSCQDAIGAIFRTLSGKDKQRRWVLDADLSAAFDRIDHDHLLARLGTFPARDLIRGWLRAGVMDKGRFAPTVEGTPQGGVISPLLLNVALHGMEDAAGVRYRYRHRPVAAAGTPVLVRYADDFVAVCESQEQAEQVKSRLAAWLTPRGLSINEDKTRIVDVHDGFDFLGFTVRRFPTRSGDKLLIKPSEEALRRVRKRIKGELRQLRGGNATDLIRRLNPIIRGWSMYYRGVVASKAFAKLDNIVWWGTWRWAVRRHPAKPRKWVAARYYGKHNPARNDRWVFGDPDSGAYLIHFSWTKIVRHVLIAGRAAPDDPALTEYWAARRRRRKPPPLDRTTLYLLKQQHGRCGHCGEFLLYVDEEPHSPHQWELWLGGTRKALRKQRIIAGTATADERTALQLVHDYCRRSTALTPSRVLFTPTRLA